MNKKDLEQELQKALTESNETFNRFEAYRIAALNTLEKDIEYVALRKAWLDAEDEADRLEKIVRGLEK